MIDQRLFWNILSGFQRLKLINICALGSGQLCSYINSYKKLKCVPMNATEQSSNELHGLETNQK